MKDKDVLAQGQVIGETIAIDVGKATSAIAPKISPYGTGKGTSCIPSLGWAAAFLLEINTEAEPAPGSPSLRSEEPRRNGRRR
jgi:hypothetical protein